MQGGRSAEWHGLAHEIAGDVAAAGDVEGASAVTISGTISGHRLGAHARNRARVGGGSWRAEQVTGGSLGRRHRSLAGIMVWAALALMGETAARRDSHVGACMLCCGDIWTEGWQAGQRGQLCIHERISEPRLPVLVSDVSHSAYRSHWTIATQVVSRAVVL